METTFTTQYDVCYDDFENVWEGVAHMVTAAAIDESEVKEMKLLGKAPHGWPIVEMTFVSVEAARRVTAAYLGIFDAEDPEVLEYLSH